MKYSLLTLLVLSSLVLVGCGTTVSPANGPDDAGKPASENVENANQQNDDINKDDETTKNDDMNNEENENDDQESGNGALNTGAANTATVYTLADLQAHNNATSCRTAIRGEIFDVSAFVEKHPGGDKNILKTCGIDATAAFESQHGGQEKPENTLAGFQIGMLQ